MIRRLIGAAARRALGSLGFELHRRQVGHSWGADPYADQGKLLGIQRVATVFDVGASVGETTTKYRRLFPESMIHAFEPFADSFQELASTHGRDAAVVLNPVAVADRHGRRPMFTNRSHYTNSFLAVAPDAARYTGPGLLEPIGRVEVDCLRLDDYCADHGVEQIDVLKIDVQGAEGEVLAGAERLLRTQAIRLIFTEAQVAPMYIGQSTLWDLQSQLDAFGYRLFGLYNLVHAGRDGLAWLDAIFVPASA